MTAIHPKNTHWLSPAVTANQTKPSYKFWHYSGTRNAQVKNEPKPHKVLAVDRLSKKLDELVKEHRVQHYFVFGWQDKQLQVQVFLSEDLYTRDNRMSIQRELSKAISEMGFYVDATLMID